MSDQLQSSAVDGAKITTGKILAWIEEWTEANHLKVPTDFDQTFAEAGFDSMHSVELAFFLEERLKIKIDDTVLFDYPTFASLAEHLLSLAQPAQAGQGDYAVASSSPAAGTGNW